MNLTPNTRRYTDLPIIAAQTWDTVTAVRAALQELQRGQFVNVAMMVEELIADDRISGVLSQRIDGLLGLPFSMSPPEGLEEDKKALDIASDAKRDWTGMADESTIRQLWLWGRFLGVGVAEKIWSTDEETWRPKLKVWHPRFLYWRWDTRSYWLTTQEGPVEIREGDPHWVIYTPYGYQRGWVHALVRALAIPWLFRQFAYRDWGRYNEVHGMPIRGLIEPSEWNDEEKQKALDEIAGLASESVVRLPQIEGKGGFDLKLIEAAAQSYDAFKLAIEQANSSIAIVILGQNLTAEVKGGSLAASQVHERVAASIIRSDAETLGTTFRRDVLVEWTVVNYGDPEAAPWLRWATEPPVDVKSKADGMKALGEAAAGLKGAGIPVDRAELAERFDIPLEEGVEFGGAGEGELGEDGQPLPPGAPADGAVVQDTALNGAQVQAMQAMVQSVADGVLPAASVKAMMVAAFPSVAPEVIEAMLAGLKDFKPKPQEPPPGAPGLEEDDQVEATEGDDEPEELSRGGASKKRRAASQGQVYADQLADHGRAFAGRILAGDHRALRQVVDQLTPTSEGGIDVQQLRERLLEVYRGMSPDKLARLTEKCLILAELSGRYAVQKEVVASPAKASAVPDVGAIVAATLAAALQSPKPQPSHLTFERGPDGRVIGATLTTKE